MTAERIPDHDGHAWPVTGTWCAVCGWPLAPTTDSPTTHPLCDDREDD